jgi:hypothetical protein
MFNVALVLQDAIKQVIACHPMISVTLCTACRASNIIIIIKLKHLSKLPIKSVYLMSSSSNLIGLKSISNEHHLPTTTVNYLATSTQNYDITFIH